MRHVGLKHSMQWQDTLSAAEQTQIIGQYCQHSELNEHGQMEWWRLADVLQYALMNSLLHSR